MAVHIKVNTLPHKCARKEPSKMEALFTTATLQLPKLSDDFQYCSPACVKLVHPLEVFTGVGSGGTVGCPSPPPFPPPSLVAVGGV
jgi:hypothetical protein